MKAIVTSFLGPTNTRGSRIIAKDSDDNRISVECRDESSMNSNHIAAVRALCRKMNWHGELVEGSLGAGKNVYVWATGPIVRTEAEK